MNNKQVLAIVFAILRAGELANPDPEKKPLDFERTMGIAVNIMLDAHDRLPERINRAQK